MSGSTSIVGAEKVALNGDNESQDSQQVLDLYQSIYGIGLLSSSPPRGDEAPFFNISQHRARTQGHGPKNERKTRVQSRSSRAGKSELLPLKATETLDATTDHRDIVSSRSSGSYTSAGHQTGRVALKAGRPSNRPARASIDNLADDQAQPCARDVHGPEPRPEPKPSGPDAANPSAESSTHRKMDSSQSPTQSNNGRSYDKYFRASQRSEKLEAIAHDGEPVPDSEALSQSSAHEQKSLSEDDTGAVVFDIDNGIPGHTGPSLPSDQSPQAFVAPARARTFALQQQTSQSQEQLPETPVVRHNPFEGNNQFQLLPTSQLFKATQFSSAFRRGASPTSSRPSPNDFPHATISPNPISSPLKARGLRSSPSTRGVSSPQTVHPAGSTRPQDERTTPLHTVPANGDDPVVPESPHYHGPKGRSAPAPMDVYVPMRQSQERRSSSIVPPDPASPEISDDEDDPIDRRRRARSMKEASLKRLTSIKVTRTPKPENVEVPSTNTKKRIARTAAQQYVHQCYGSQAESESQERVQNSQEASSRLAIARADDHGEPTQSTQGEEPLPAEDGIAKSSATDGQPNPKRRRGRGLLLRLDSTETNVANGDTIPETSPVDKTPRHLSGTSAISSSMIGKRASEDVVVGSSRNLNDDNGVPKSSVTAYVPPTTGSGTPGNSSGPELPRAVPSDPEQHKPSIAVSELSPLRAATLPSSPPAPAFSTRSKTRQQQDVNSTVVTPAAPLRKELLDPSTSMSTLSALSGTPSLTRSQITPGSRLSEARPAPQVDHLETPNSSPADARNKQRRLADLPRLRTRSTTDSQRLSKRLSRQQPIHSTDELAKSPSVTTAFENSARGPLRNSALRATRTNAAEPQLFRDQSNRRSGKLFDGMAFAISFRGKQPGERKEAFDEREKLAESLGSMITQAGGRLLENGFIELFHSGSGRSVTASPASSMSSTPSQAADGGVSLTPAARRLGFTALIADGHSRKAKYMQALALGLPCIAARWITTCLDNGAIVDWAPYLLCAGESTYLGGAYKSRVLAPYDASEARLAQVIETRPRLLQGSRVLLVMKKSEEENGMAYVFLARVLGATICRAHSMDEARAKMKAPNDMGQPFDWVYAEAGTSSMKAGGNSKKRKRGGNNTTSPVGTSNDVRTLTDELVIQSLILGRLLQEGEM